MVALGLVTAGCGGVATPRITDFASGTDNPIQISRTRLVHAVSFAPSSATLDSAQVSALFAFIAGHGVGPADTIIVERGAGALDGARAETLSHSLSGAGLHPTVATDPALVAGVTRVVIERYVAIAPNCPDWTPGSGPNFENYNQRNFGCADARNLAAMVADPKDLAMGASLGPQKGDTVTRPIFTYHQGAPALVAGPPGAGGAGQAGGAPGAAPGGAMGSGPGGGATTGAPGSGGP